jgi:hypothetical protein
MGLKDTIIEEWGVIDYQQAWDRQTLIQKSIIDKELSPENVVSRQA